MCVSSRWSGFLSTINIYNSRLTGDSKLPVGECECGWHRASVSALWWTVQGVARLSPNVSWDPVQAPHDPAKDKIDDGWRFLNLVVILYIPKIMYCVASSSHVSSIFYFLITLFLLYLLEMSSMSYVQHFKISSCCCTNKLALPKEGRTK